MTEPQELREWLSFYRDGDAYRTGGQRFDAVWEQSVERVCRTSPEGAWWRATFAAQRESWRRAYVGEPATACELALGVLADYVAEQGGVHFEDTGRICQRCGGPIPRDRKGSAIFCSDTCTKAASRERVAA